MRRPQRRKRNTAGPVPHLTKRSRGRGKRNWKATKRKAKRTKRNTRRNKRRENMNHHLLPAPVNPLTVTDTTEWCCVWRTSIFICQFMKSVSCRHVVPYLVPYKCQLLKEGFNWFSGSTDTVENTVPRKWVLHHHANFVKKKVCSSLKHFGKHVRSLGSWSDVSCLCSSRATSLQIWYTEQSIVIHITEQFRGKASVSVSDGYFFFLDVYTPSCFKPSLL